MSSKLEEVCLSYRLIRYGARINEIKIMCPGLTKKELRDRYYEVHQCSARSGKNPTKPDFFFSTRNTHRLSSYLANSFIKLNLVSSGSLVNCKDTGRFVDAYEHYALDFDDELIGISRALLLLKELRMGSISTTKCDDCSVPYIISPITPKLYSCPYCAIKKQLERLCCHCGEPVQDRGRCRNKRCQQSQAAKRRQAITSDVSSLCSVALPGL
ncbi:FlhC family transcriptional regulator [Salinisphaera sp. P385]|uniref:FlhC family transcriptional regulator n=1 Tax=Spectribacter acetivorans TaxID=3075603 RepID=A0ABU3B7Y1_9GAMM|nr:FlhC family transcriptional regulator [Salinisphaera sp. P385]MDT0618564.1 FlhC family transcriptional regulator [Salinisphaera sp. P385]